MIHCAPSYIKEIAQEADTDTLEAVQKAYGDDSTAFMLNAQFKQVLRTWSEEYNEYGETFWGITNANEKIKLFDPFENGYNGQYHLSEKEDDTITRTVDLKYDRLVLAFQYSGDEDSFTVDGNSKLPEDYFEWIAIYQYGNNHLEEIENIECS